MRTQVSRPTPPRPLRDRAISAGVWTLSAYGTELCVRLTSNLILTRLLFPEAFGAITAAMALISGLALISDVGLRAVIVQSPNGEGIDFLRSAWLFQLWRGLAIWIALGGICALLSVPAIRNMLPAASVFAEPAFPILTFVVGFTVVLAGAESTAIALNVRRVHFRPIVWLDLISKILSLPITLGWAWIAPSPWAIVGGMLTANLVRLVLSHLCVPGPWMSFNWDKRHFAEIVQFGRWIMVSSWASFFGEQFDVILLGILTSASTLGLYSIAKLLVTTGEGLLDRLSGALALPIFSEVIRNDPSNLRNRYYQFRLPLDITAGLFSGGLFVTGTFLVHFLYDERYAQAGLMLQILSLSTLTYPFPLIASAFTATGDTHISAIASISKAAALVTFITIGFLLFGEIGAIAGIAAHRVIPSIVMTALARKRNWIGTWHEFRIIPAFIAGLLVGKTCLLLTAVLGVHSIHDLLHIRSHSLGTR